MSDLTTACDTCNPAVSAVFDAVTGTRQVEYLAGDLFVTDQCFVRDEIKFLNAGRLIFAPAGRGEGQYLDRYYVICRKISVVGGFKSGGGIVPCGPDDPGTEYKNNNVITWLDRLKSASKGAAIPAPAANGTSFGNWIDMGQGNDGVDGGRGADGQKGNRGTDGKDAPRQLIVIALEVEVQPLGHLNIDWDGQNGGGGGQGQKGGNGGKAMNGRIGQSDTTWPGTGCDREPGNGGNGGNGGDGGPGGDGGNGGRAGDIIIITTHANLTSGDFINGNITYRNDGGDGGVGGSSGVGGNFGGAAGQPGFSTSECSNASPGQNGQPGVPAGFPPPLDSDPNRGATGAPGGGGAFMFEEVQAGTCADLLPLPMNFDASGLQPSHFCRGFSTPSAEDASVTGQHFKQAVSVTTNLSGVTPTIKLSSTDTELDLHFAIAGNSATGAGNLTFKRVFGPDVALANAYTVGRFEVLTVAPTSGTKGNAVNVTITGNCFDPSAGFQQVVVSGLGVTVLNVVVVDEHNVQCVFDINALAGSGARDVTVKTGTFTHTLVNAFTIS